MAAPHLQVEEIHFETAKVPFSDRLLLDTQAAAEMLSVSTKVLDKLPIPRIRIEGIRRVLWRRSDLEDYVRSL